MLTLLRVEGFECSQVSIADVAVALLSSTTWIVHVVDVQVQYLSKRRTSCADIRCAAHVRSSDTADLLRKLPFLD